MLPGSHKREVRHILENASTVTMNYKSMNGVDQTLLQFRYF
jgi:hypothetical protein